MNRHVMIVLAVAALVRTSAADEIEMPADNVRPPDSAHAARAKARDTRAQPKPNRPQPHVRPKLAPAKEVAEDDDAPPGLSLAPAKEPVAKPDTSTPDGAPDTATAQQVQQEAMHSGLLLLTCGTYGNVVRLLPALVVEHDQVSEAVEILAAAVQKAATR